MQTMRRDSTRRDNTRRRTRNIRNDPGNGAGLKGKRFGELVVLRPSRSGRAGAWVAQCDCGKLALVYDYLLKSGETTSCGCQKS
jgi:hypothetical protein